MSSHCFIKVEKHLIAKDIEQDLKEIIHRRFNDLLTLECHINQNEICDWDVKFDSIYGFHICLKTNNSLDFIHPDNAWSYWAQLVFEDELAIKYSGQMIDEEYPHQKIQPLPEYHITFEKYLDLSMHHSKEWKKAIIAIELSHLPPALRNLK